MSSPENDRAGIEQLKKQFEEIMQLTEGEFKGVHSYASRVNHYFTVYSYAIKADARDFSYTRLDTLYVDYQDLLTQFMQKFPRDASIGEAELFSRMVKWWKHYKVVSLYCIRTFGYLSRYYVQQWAKMSLEQVAMSIFLEQLFRRHERVVKDTILDLVQKERRHEMIDRETVRSAIEMYSAMSMNGLSAIYTKNFFEHFVKQTYVFYCCEGARWSKTDAGTVYLAKAEQCLQEEKMRCAKYFTMEEETKIMETVEEALLDTENAKNVLFCAPTGGFASVIDCRDVDNLKRFYKMFAHRSSGLEMLAQTFKGRLIFEGTEKTKSHGGEEKNINCKECVTDLVVLHDDFYGLVQTCFSSNPLMMKALRDGLERVFNNGIVATDPSGRSIVVSFSELLANYLDMIMRQPPGDERIIETVFDQVVSVLRYVSDNDHFQQHARELLAKRLLSQTSKPNEALERLLLSRLKQRCGAHFTTQFEGMLNDRNTSIELCDRFKSYAEDTTPLLFEFQCMVLKTGIWPKFPVEDGVRPPAAFLAVMQRFSAFHNDEAKHRLLKWSHNTSHVTLTARIKPTAVKELLVTAFQSWVLLMFNSATHISVGSMIEELNLEMEELKRILMSFAKLKLVMRESDTGPLQKNDVFVLNSEFSSPQRKITIPLGVPRITVAGSAKAAQQADEDRKPAVDAALVRIMKSRRELPHTDLVQECISQLRSRFMPDPKLIKQRIEDLIKREYIERTAANNSVYRYLA